MKNSQIAESTEGLTRLVMTTQKFTSAFVGLAALSVQLNGDLIYSWLPIVYMSWRHSSPLAADCNRLGPSDEKRRSPDVSIL